ncbi:MAG: Fe-S cluster assembly ATPase SufC [Brachymonas sp.]|nr:Fe-S cluster assembly ATPase SufC [Brachymonas sp.]
MPNNTPLLSVRDLNVEVAGHHVLKGLTLDVARGQVVVVMGANGSGKSTLGFALAGHPRYTITGGSATLDGKDLLALEPEERAHAGLFLSYQAPPDVPGVKNNLFIRTALNAVREARGDSPMDAFDFLERARAISAPLGLPDAMLSRPVNDGFSGGERKRNELLQMALLQPQLAILDEIDSGMDVDGLRAVVDLVQQQRKAGRSLMVISHQLSLIEMLKPDQVIWLSDGRVGETGGLELAQRLAAEGYAQQAESEKAPA